MRLVEQKLRSKLHTATSLSSLICMNNELIEEEAERRGMGTAPVTWYGVAADIENEWVMNYGS